MKKYIILFLSIYSFSAYAGLSSLLLGALLGSSASKQEKQLSDLQRELIEVKKNIPILCKNADIHFKCWDQFSKEILVVPVSNKNSEQILKYFQQNQYNVKLQNNNLVFNFKNEFLKYKAHSSVLISYEFLFLFIMASFIPLFFIYVFVKKKSNLKKIKELYPNSQLFFWDLSKKHQLEQSLENNQVPSSWSFEFNDEKITSIISYSNGRLEKIAMPKDVLVNAFRR